MKTSVGNNKKKAGNKRALNMFKDRQLASDQHTHRLLAILLPLQWLGVIINSVRGAGFFTDQIFSIPLPLKISVIAGAAVILISLIFAIFRPRDPFTRYVITAGQIAMSLLLVYVTEGQI